MLRPVGALRKKATRSRGFMYSDVIDCPMNNSLSVLRALTYFDLFDYPLTREEIDQFMDKRIAAPDLDRVLQYLTDSTVVLNYNNYFCLKSPEVLVKRREAGNELAAQLIPKAMRISRFLYQFPFVRGEGIS